jgi:hypothetical protein
MSGSIIEDEEDRQIFEELAEAYDGELVGEVSKHVLQSSKEETRS